MSTAKQRKANMEAVAALLSDYGASRARSIGYDWIVDTPHGLLSVSLWPEDDGRSIFMRWYSQKPPALAWDANPHSGKWNIHGDTMADALAELHRRLERVGCVRHRTEPPATAL